MTIESGQEVRVRSPGKILAALLGILALCAAVIFWDQSRQSGDAVSASPPSNSAPAGNTAPANSGSSGNYDGMGDLK